MSAVQGVSVEAQAEARALLAAGDAAGAVPLLEAAGDPGSQRASVVHDLVGAYHRAGRTIEAITLLRRLVAALPDRPALFEQLSAMARGAGQWSVVEEAECRLTELRPADPAAWRRLGAARRRLGDRAGMAEAILGWARAAPDDPSAAHMAAALTGQTLDRASDEYVRALFDTYAPRFDEHLAGLHYRAPELVAGEVDRLLAAPVECLADLGCGTGLLGPLLRDRAIRLVGVDLSPQMLARAEARGSYDELVEGELTTFLRQRPASFDVLVSADTLNYIGDLRPVFAAAHAALRPQGLFVLTLEHGGEVTTYQLERSGRFTHHMGWVRDELEVAGFEAPTITPCVLRREGGAEVAGIVVASARPEG